MECGSIGGENTCLKKKKTSGVLGYLIMELTSVSKLFCKPISSLLSIRW